MSNHPNYLHFFTPAAPICGKFYMQVGYA